MSILQEQNFVNKIFYDQIKKALADMCLSEETFCLVKQ